MIFLEGAVVLSKFSFAGEGIDAGMLSMAGYGIYHNERKSIYELPDAVKALTKDNRAVMVAASKGQAERLRDIFMNNDVIAPLVAKENIAEYEGNISITVGELSSGFFSFRISNPYRKRNLRRKACIQADKKIKSVRAPYIAG